MTDENHVNVESERRESTNILIQEDFFLPSNRGSINLQLTGEALVWSPTSKNRNSSMKRLWSGAFSVQETERVSSQDYQQLVEPHNRHLPVLRTSQSYPNGFNSSQDTHYRVSISDVVGCEAARGRQKDDKACYLRIYAYPIFKKFPWQSSTRKRKELTFGFSKEETFERNFEELLKWENMIKMAVEKQNSTSVELNSLSPTSGRKKLLILVNPFGGAGKALHVFQYRVIPILAEAGVMYETVITKCSGHARNIAKEINLKQWGCIVVVSGDGLIYEVINGLMERSDYTEAIKTPIGALPGGSGNALVCSLLYQAGESVKHNLITNSTLQLVRNRVQPMDLVALDTCKGDRLYSFLSVAWGIVADVDIESERYRNLGKARFTLGTIARILCLRKYHGKLHFLPINPAYKSKWLSYDRSSCEVLMGDQSNEGDGETRGGIVRNKQVSDHIETTALACDSTTQCASGRVPECFPNQEIRGPDCSRIIPTPLLNLLDQPVPSGWVTISANDFISVVAVYQTHLSQDMLILPHSRLKDGCIYLGIIRGDMSRYRLLQIFNAMQTGNFEIMEDDCFEMIKVSAFRIEPGPSNGIITVDGEVVDYGPIQGQVIEGLARVIA